MSAVSPSGLTTLADLSPAPGDAPAAMVLLRDLLAAVAARPEGLHGDLDASRVLVTDEGRVVLTAPGSPAAPVSPRTAAEAADLAPELFDGAPTSERSDVYAAACLALSRYLGGPAVVGPSVSRGAPPALALAATRYAHRHSPARLGELPEPFRRLVALALAKPVHLRPAPADLLVELDAAFARAEGSFEAGVRSLHRAVLLARAFRPAPVVAMPLAAEDDDDDVDFVPGLAAAPRRRARAGSLRAVLVGAATVVALGGVTAAAAVGLTSGSDDRPTVADPAPTSAAPTPSTTARTTAVTTRATTSAPATTSAAATATPTDDTDVSDDGSDAGADPGVTYAGGGGFTPGTTVAPLPPVSDPPTVTLPPSTPPTSASPGGGSSSASGTPSGGSTPPSSSSSPVPTITDTASPRGAGNTTP